MAAHDARNRAEPKDHLLVTWTKSTSIDDEGMFQIDSVIQEDKNIRKVDEADTSLQNVMYVRRIAAAARCRRERGNV
jgi:hypothetical protein